MAPERDSLVGKGQGVAGTVDGKVAAQVETFGLGVGKQFDRCPIGATRRSEGGVEGVIVLAIEASHGIGDGRWVRILLGRDCGIISELGGVRGDRLVSRGRCVLGLGLLLRQGLLWGNLLVGDGGSGRKRAERGHKASRDGSDGNATAQGAVGVSRFHIGLPSQMGIGCPHSLGYSSIEVRRILGILLN